MKTCIIHVGMHKTGTKSIQKSLFDFEDASFYYARIGGRPNHSTLLSDLFSQKTRANRRSRSPVVSDVAGINSMTEAELRASIKSAGDRTMIISGESIGVLSPAKLKVIRDWLKPHFDAIKIIAYVRPPLGYMSSVFQQRARGGAVSGLSIDIMYRSYRESFEKFDEVFDASNVILKLFDRSALVQGDVVADFCTTIGLDLPPERIVKANESSPRDGICLRVQYNRYCYDNGDLPFRGREGPVLSAIDQLGTAKFRLSPLVMGPFVEANRQDIDWINARMGINFDALTEKSEPGDITSEEDLLAPVPGAREMLLRLFAELEIVQPEDDIPDGEMVHILTLAAGGTARRTRKPDENRKRNRANAGAVKLGRKKPANRRAAVRRRRREKSSGAA